MTWWWQIRICKVHEQINKKQNFNIHSFYHKEHKIVLYVRKPPIWAWPVLCQTKICKSNKIIITEIWNKFVLSNSRIAWQTRTKYFANWRVISFAHMTYIVSQAYKFVQTRSEPYYLASGWHKICFESAHHATAFCCQSIISI